MLIEFLQLGQGRFLPAAFRFITLHSTHFLKPNDRNDWNCYYVISEGIKIN